MTKLNKTLVQALILQSKGAFAKDLARSIKAHSHLDVCFDEKVGLTLSFNSFNDRIFFFAKELGHHIIPSPYTGVRLLNAKQDQYELSPSSIKIPCDELVAPEYEIITVKDVLNIPRSESHLEVYNLLEEFIEGLDSYDIPYEERNIPCPEVEIKQLMSYSQGYSGKYGNELHVVTFKGEDVALVYAGGKWTDSYTITEVSKNYGKMVDLLKEIYTSKEDNFLELSDEFVMDSNLEEMYYNKTYTVSEGE